MADPYRRPDGQPTIGLAMIVKDEEERLPRLLDSLGWGEGVPEEAVWTGEGAWRPDAAVDFVVVCDTGSSDDSVRIATERGCRVVKFDWCDDFSAARAASYEALPDDLDWTLWADADDLIEGAENLRPLAARAPQDVAGFICRYDYAQDPNGNCVCELWRERLVRHNIGAKWKLPIHEVLEVPGPLIHTDEVLYRHRAEGRERDPERNYKILSADREKAIDEDRLPDPRTLAYLGTEALALGKREEAVRHFETYLARPDAAWDEERCQVAHKLSIAHRLGQDLEAAEAAGRQAITERPDWADGYLDMAEIELGRGKPERAMRWLEVIDKLDPPRTLLIINPLEYSYQPLLMRSVALAKLGQGSEALALTNQVLAITPFREDLQIQRAQLAAAVTQDDAVKAVLGLREILVRFDENAKARALMDCVPYIAETSPLVAQARWDQREMTLHATDPEVYRSYYRENPNEAPFERQGVEIKDAHETFQRVRFLRAGLEKLAA